MRAELSCWLPLRFKHKNGIDFSWGWAMSRLTRHASTTEETYIVGVCVLWKKMTCESLVGNMKWVCMNMKKGKLKKTEFISNGKATQYKTPPDQRTSKNNTQFCEEYSTARTKLHVRISPCFVQYDEKHY